MDTAHMWCTDMLKKTATCIKINKYLNKINGGRNVSEAKSAFCSCRGPKFWLWHPHGYSLLSITPGPGDPKPSYGYYKQQVHTVTQVCQA